MDYQEYPPHPLLSSTVECYWSMNGFAEVSDYTVFPDGCMDVLFDFSALPSGVCQSEPGQNSIISSVIGNMTKPIFVQNGGGHDMFGIRFKAGGLHSFVADPLSLFTDRAIALTDCHSIFDSATGEKLVTLSGRNRARFLDQFLLRHVEVSISSRPDYWQWAIRKIESRHGSISIQALATEVGFSVKHLERKILERTGLTPKQLSQVMRFKELKKKLKNYESPNLMTLAWEFGYSDHAHLTKSFKTFAGITPSDFLEQFGNVAFLQNAR